MSVVADYWVELQLVPGKPVWHRFRHVPTNAGGTYGWWRVCYPHGQGPNCSDRDGVGAPPPGAKVCPRCRRGVAAWQRACDDE